MPRWVMERLLFPETNAVRSHSDHIWNGVNMLLCFTDFYKTLIEWGEKTQETSFLNFQKSAIKMNSVTPSSVLSPVGAMKNTLLVRNFWKAKGEGSIFIVTS